MYQEFLDEWHSDSPTIQVHTSGSTGVPKILWVEKERMRASAQATCKFLRIPQQATALLCLPTRYIAGKMMVVRADIWPLTLKVVEPSNHPFEKLDEPPFFAAITPTQAHESLRHPHERQIMLSIPRLLIGGGAIGPELERELQSSSGEVWSSYGMTETLSHIALRRIGTVGYTPLPGVTIGTDAEHCLWIEAPHVCQNRLQTNDIIKWNPDGSFCIVGRRDNTINSGGIKIQLEQIEEIFAAHNGLTTPTDFIFTWTHSDKWEQALTLLHTTPLAPQIPDSIPHTHHPKHILYTNSLPTTVSGKPARMEIHQLAEQLIKKYKNDYLD